jgi:hypothetical protein
MIPVKFSTPSPMNMRLTFKTFPDSQVIKWSGAYTGYSDGRILLIVIICVPFSLLHSGTSCSIKKQVRL